jgi:heme exporter protein D
MPHNESYVLASYALTFVAMIVIIGWVWIDSRARWSELKRLEEQGIRRRSDKGSAVEKNKGNIAP